MNGVDIHALLLVPVGYWLPWQVAHHPTTARGFPLAPATPPNIPKSNGRTILLVLVGIPLAIIALLAINGVVDRLRPPLPEHAVEATKEAKAVARQTAEATKAYQSRLKAHEARYKAAEDLEKDVAKVLRPHKDIEVQLSENALTEQWSVWAEFTALRVATDSIETEIMEACKKIYTSDVPVQMATFVVSGELVDRYGNDMLVPIYTSEMDRETGMKINWERDYMVEPSRVMNIVWMHPVLR